MQLVNHFQEDSGGAKGLSAENQPTVPCQNDGPARAIQDNVMMRRQTIFFVVLLVAGFGRVQGQGLVKTLREELFYTAFDERSSLAYYEKIKRIPRKTPLLEAYEGAAIALQANFTWNPVAKLGYIRRSNKALSSAIGKDGQNIEMRFLRFYIQNQVPAYLGYSKNLQEDKQAILSNLVSYDLKVFGKDIVAYIRQYMLEAGHCTPEEFTAISSALQE